MNTFDNETPKYRKKKNQTSKSSHRSDHKHDYERVIIEGWVGGFYWTDRCKICGRTKSLSYALAREGLRKPKTTPYISSKDDYTLEEVHDKFPDKRVFQRRRDEEGHLCWEDSDLIEIIFSEKGDT